MWFVLGVRGSGKSSFLENLGILYLNQGSTILDLFSSRDGELLCWLRSPYAESKKILLLRGENTDVNSSFPSKKVSDVKLADFERFDIIISSPPLSRSMDEEFLQIAELTNLIYRRLHWKRLIYTIMREASNFIYPRQKLADDQGHAKVQAVYMLREARHAGLALGLDSVRLLSIDIDVRSLADYLILKSQGMGGLTRDLRWLYSFFHPYVMRNCPPQYFFIVSRGGSVGVGEFSCPQWHKREKEDILRAVGIKIEFGEPVEKGEYRGPFKTIGDQEHCEIVTLYIEEELGMHKIAAKLNRSTASIQSHIKTHNKSVQKSGFCPSCRRAKGEFENRPVKRW